MRCPYCIKEHPKNAMTKDHVIAKSWYPQQIAQRVTVRACEKCNHGFGKLEEDMLLKLGMCIDGNNPAAAGIVEKIMRSIDPAHGKNALDKKRRQHRREELKRGLIEIENVQLKSTLPFSLPNLAKGARTAITVSTKELNRVIEKWVRGFHFSMLGEFIEPEYEIAIHHVSEDGAEQAFREIIQFATVLRHGPGVVVTQVTKTEGGDRYTIYGFEIWGQFKAYASVFPPEKFEKLKTHLAESEPTRLDENNNRKALAP